MTHFYENRGADMRADEARLESRRAASDAPTATRLGLTMIDPGRLRHRVTLQQTGDPVPDGTGGYTEGLTTLVSRAPAAVEQATAANLERLGANTISPMATHLVTLRYLPGVTTKTEAIFHDDGVDRALAITGVYDFEARHRVLQLACVERMAT